MPSPQKKAREHIFYHHKKSMQKKVCISSTLGWRMINCSPFILSFQHVYKHLGRMHLLHACISCHMLTCTSVTASRAWCLCLKLLVMKHLFSACQSNDLFCLLAVYRALPAKLPYNTVWLTSQQQTDAAVSQSISYYTSCAALFQLRWAYTARKQQQPQQQECRVI